MTSRDPIYFPTWPYFFLASLALGLAIWILVSWMPPWRPELGDLVKVEGAVVKVEVRDDISDTSAGAVWPMLTSVYFTLDKQKGEFRYPFTHPDYAMARDNTSGFLELWVDKSEVGTDSPVMIWQLQEHSDYNYLYPETSIKFEQISAHLDKIGHSRHRLAVRLIFASLGLWAIGRFLGFWNRRRQAIPRR